MYCTSLRTSQWKRKSRIRAMCIVQWFLGHQSHVVCTLQFSLNRTRATLSSAYLSAPPSTDHAQVRIWPIRAHYIGLPASAATAYTWASLSPPCPFSLYPTSLKRPMISPMEKKPMTSAATTPALQYCALDAPRTWLRMVLGFMRFMSEAGWRRAFMAGWR